MSNELPRILSPNLGCPFLLTLEELKSRGFDLVVAVKGAPPSGQLSLKARPSFRGEGMEFSLELGEPLELSERTLPAEFKSIEETRFLISATLYACLFNGQARFFRYRAKPIPAPGKERLRKIGNELRMTLYDLHLVEEEKNIGAVFHALGLHPGNEGLRFIHLTDLHVALRNDLYADNMRENVTFPASPGGPPKPPQPPGPPDRGFNNFNENLRRFIRYANGLADGGKIDFVLVLGDLVDFLRHGVHEGEDFGDNNFRVFRNLVLGEGGEKGREDPIPGLKVPIFTSTGNHDWRFFPYSAERSHKAFGIDKQLAGQLDLYWADEQEAISGKIEETYRKLLGGELAIQGGIRINLFQTPIRRAMQWLQKVTASSEQIEKTLQRGDWQKQVSTFLGTTVVVGLFSKIPWVGPLILKWFGLDNPIQAGLVVSFLVSAIINLSIVMARRGARLMCESLLSIEAGWRALGDYFLNINPFFNYGFRLGDHSFLILDTGHDCMRAQYLWDEGEKKMGPLSLRDNTIGQSPDSMAFYDINEYYHYSQIGWIERVLKLIRKETQPGGPSGRLFVGLHAPPANLSRDEARKAQKRARDQAGGILLPEGEFEIRYGTINHYLSHFFHLCLGRTEQDPEKERYPRVDLVLAGHAHWRMEFRLSWENGPKVYFGDFSGKAAKFPEDFDRYRPFLFQTPACGPREDFSPNPPYFRLIEIDKEGRILSVAVMELDGKGGAKEADLPDF
jgi:hypothetical protein